MRRLLWVLLGLALLAAALWVAGRRPSSYFLEQECARYQEERRHRLTLLNFEIRRAEESVQPEFRARVEELLMETRRIEIRGWEVVLVPPGARAPGSGYDVAVRTDPSTPEDPAPLRGMMTAWLRPRTWLARLFAWG